MKQGKSKIKTLRNLLPIINRLKSSGKKIVLAHGVFDLLHYGHIHYLQQSKELGDILVVSVKTDKFVEKGPGRPIFSEKERFASVQTLGCVDYVVPCNQDGPYEILEKMKPDIYTKGDDSASQLKNPHSGLRKDKKLVESGGGVFRFTKSLPVHSAGLLRTIASRSPKVLGKRK